MEVDSSNPSSSTEGSRATRHGASTDPQKNPHGLLPFFVDGNPIKNGRKTLRSAFSGAFFKVLLDHATFEPRASVINEPCSTSTTLQMFDLLTLQSLK